MRSVNWGIPIFLLTLVFGFNLIDFPPASASHASRCCCSRESLCHCKHMRGNCSFKQVAPPAAQNSGPGIKPFGCGSKDEAAVSPVVAKEFYLNTRTELFVPDPSQSFSAHFPLMISFLPDLRLDRPPRIF